MVGATITILLGEYDFMTYPINQVVPLGMPGLHHGMIVRIFPVMGWCRKHIIDMHGIEDSEFPEQIVPLPDPEKLEPLVPFAVKKQVFKPDGDGNTKIRDKYVTLEGADLADDLMVPLSLYGRDYDALGNQLWLAGAGQLIVWGAGNGMLQWVALNKRIPSLTVFESEAHKDVVMEHLLKKIMEAMNNPKNTRFYKSDEDLGVSAGTPGSAPKALPKGKAKTNEPGKKEPAIILPDAPKKKDKSSSSSSSSDDKKKEKK